jgi:hypothetical protein
MHPVLNVILTEAALDGDTVKERWGCSASRASNSRARDRDSAWRDGGKAGWSMVAHQSLKHSHGSEREASKMMGIQNCVDSWQSTAELSKGEDTHRVKVDKNLQAATCYTWAWRSHMPWKQYGDSKARKDIGKERILRKILH